MSPISKFLRILRIEHGENAKEMADKLGISPSYLSAIENGKRAIPASFCNELVSQYGLNEAKEKEFRRAVEESSSVIKLNFSDSRSNVKTMKIKDIVFTLAKSDVSDELVNKMYELIK